MAKERKAPKKTKQKNKNKKLAHIEKQTKQSRVKWLGVGTSLLPPSWDADPLLGYCSFKFASTNS